ncbi:MAG TPA: hypothetical protein VL944_03485 [Candidatus Acidoferrum sp.]|nr:hypothetical protein [Candidatus Acidoferrum sp.]
MPSVPALSVTGNTREEQPAAVRGVDLRGSPVDMLLDATNKLPEGPLHAKLKLSARVFRRTNNDTSRDRAFALITRDIAVMILEGRHTHAYGSSGAEKESEAFRATSAALMAVADEEERRKLLPGMQSHVYSLVKEGVRDPKEIASIIQRNQDSVTRILRTFFSRGMVNWIEVGNRRYYVPVDGAEEALPRTQGESANADANAARVETLVALSRAFEHMADEGPDSKKAAKEARLAFDLVSGRTQAKRPERKIGVEKLRIDGF